MDLADRRRVLAKCAEMQVSTFGSDIACRCHNKINLQHTQMLLYTAYIIMNISVILLMIGEGNSSINRATYFCSVAVHFPLTSVHAKVL